MNNITAQDLMLGDWVYYKDKKQMPCRVKSIIGNNIRFDDGTPQDWMSDVKNFTPIPLTAEILEKNGFVKQWNNNWQLNDYHSIIISENFYIAIFELSIRLDYVHELQRALRLCSIDKEIEL